MMRLIDVACPAGHVTVDVWVKSLDSKAYPLCHCGAQTERTWAFVKAPGITPQGTRPERNTDKPQGPAKVDSKAIALETMREVEQKWLRYSDEKVAEQHVSREINEASGLCDAAGNEKPLPKPAPITFPKPTPAECAV